MGEVSGVGGGEAPRGGGKGEDVEDEAVGMKGEWRDNNRRRGEPGRVEEVEDEAADRAGDGEEE